MASSSAPSRCLIASVVPADVVRSSNNLSSYRSCDLRCQVQLADNRNYEDDIACYWQVRIIVSGIGDYRYVDCVAIRAGKQEALEYIRALFNVPLSRCVAAGDSGNDILMLEGRCLAFSLAILQIALAAPC